MADELVEAVAMQLCRAGGYGLCVGFCHSKRCTEAIENYGHVARAIIPLVREAELADKWQDISTAPRDGTEFLSYGGAQCVGKVQPTRWLSPGPYTTENGKNTEGQRRYQWPDGFYWAGYDGFVGPVEPTRWTPMPVICGEHTQESQPSESKETSD